jgi:hypothetical protein
MTTFVTALLATLSSVATPQGQLQFIEVCNVDTTRKPGVTMFTGKKWTGRYWTPRSLFALPTPDAEALGIVENS